MMFKALLLNKTEAGFTACMTELNEAQLPPGDVRGRVEYSCLNYKDGLAVTNRGPVVRADTRKIGANGVDSVEQRGW